MKWIYPLFIVAICCVGSGTIACESGQPGREDVSEVVSKETHSEVVQRDASEKFVPDETHPPTEKKEETSVVWPEKTFKHTVMAGFTQMVPLPKATGGKEPYTYRMTKSAEGVTLKDNTLQVRLKYSASTPVELQVVVRDANQKEATLDVQLTNYIPEWSSLPMTDGPPARANPAMDVAGRKILVFGGYLQGNTGSNDLWIYDRDTQKWTMAKATGKPPRKGGVYRWAVTKVEKKGDYIEGVVAQVNSGNVGYNTVHAFALEGGNVVWKELISHGDPPSGLALSSAGYDPVKRRFYLFGGGNLQTNRLSNDLFSFSYSMSTGIADWVKHTMKTSPTARFGSQFAMDQVNGKLYVVGGTAARSRPADVWVLSTRKSNLEWKEIKVEGTFVGRQNGAAVLDIPNQRLFVWGGSGGGFPPAGVATFCLKDAKPTWELLPTPQKLKPRTSTYGISDPVTGETFIGFGRRPTFLSDLWLFRTHPPSTSKP